MTRASAPLSRNHRRAEPGTPHVNDPTAPSPPKSPPNDEESRKIREHVHQARRVLDLSIDYYQQFKRAGDQLATEQFTEAQLRCVLNELYPSGADDAASDRTRRSREHTKHQIIELFVHGETQGNAPGTKWAAINAIVEHADYWQSAVMRSRSPAVPWSCSAGPVDFG